jgi:hypothetical protein
LQKQHGDACEWNQPASRQQWHTQCDKLLRHLYTHKKVELYFATPVDVVKFNLVDYYGIIKHPMDLGTVKKKLMDGAETSSQVYKNANQFVSDVRLVFYNCYAYNPGGTDIVLFAQELSRKFELKLAELAEAGAGQVGSMQSRMPCLSIVTCPVFATKHSLSLHSFLSTPSPFLTRRPCRRSACRRRCRCRIRRSCRKRG